MTPIRANRKPWTPIAGAGFLLLFSALSASRSAAGHSAAALLAHWRFDGVVDGRIQDATGNGHDAVFFSRDDTEPVLTDGIHGQAVSLSARREEGFAVLDSAKLNVAGPFTVMAWVRPNRRNAAFSIACMKGDKSGDPPWPGWRLRFFWARAVLQLGTPEGDEPSVASPQWSVPPGFWSHVAATWDGAELRIYVNAVEKGKTAFQGTVAAQNPGRPLVLGNYIGRKNAYAFDGLIDDVRVYSACLPADAILDAASCSETTP